jgi:hypothetical protein
MRKGIPSALLVCALAGVLGYLILHRSPPPATGTATSISSPGQNPPPPPGISRPPRNTNPPTAGLVAETTANLPTSSAATPPAGVSGRLFFGGPDSTPVLLAPDTVLENMRMAVRNYGSMFGGNPVGTNPEITQALNGANPKEVKFLDPENGMRVNSNGELVDSWGTPFFFHQLSANEMEIRSAGPDKQMWTADDLVIK